MRRHARSLLCVFAACAALAAPAGALLAVAPVPAVRPLYFEHLTVRDGLSQSTVMSILQDSQGYLWLATESGLDRYDGYSIHEYRRERGRAGGLANDYTWTNAEDAHGELGLRPARRGAERRNRDTRRWQ